MNQSIQHKFIKEGFFALEFDKNQWFFIIF
jgi:hypothetical protein